MRTELRARIAFSIALICIVCSLFLNLNQKFNNMENFYKKEIEKRDSIILKQAQS